MTIKETTILNLTSGFDKGREPPRIIVAKDKLNCNHLIGRFLDESHFDTLIESDTDCFGTADCDVATKIDCNDESDCATCDKVNGRDEKKIAFIFRKNFFSKEEQETAYAGLREAATPSQNRGLAAGPKGEKCNNREYVTDEQLDILDDLMNDAMTLTGEKDRIDEIRASWVGRKPDSSRGNVWMHNKTKAEGFTFNEWVEKTRQLPIDQRAKEAKRVAENFISTTTYANTVNSGICGTFDRYPRIPYLRETSYTENNYEKFKMAFPFLKTLNDAFKHYLPWRWGNQRKAADKIDQRYLVPDTVFTTITVNKTFRTAAHLDAGDLSDGLSNLLVLSNNGDYTGGYLVFPEYRIAVNVRPGDLLLVNNHEIIHGNTPIVLGSEEAERISLVCYFREGMMFGGVKEYEDLRKQFIESRRLNNKHPLWRPLWNGVSPAWDSSQEWYDYIREHGKEEWLSAYHPEALEEKNVIDL